jgi:hypothetical protein
MMRRRNPNINEYESSKFDPPFADLFSGPRTPAGNGY